MSSSNDKFTCESVFFRRFDRDKVWASSDCSWQVIFEPSTEDTDFLTSAAGAWRKSKRVGILLSTPDGYSPIVTETGRCLPVSLSSLRVDWLVLLNTGWNTARIYIYKGTNTINTNFYFIFTLQVTLYCVVLMGIGKYFVFILYILN